MQIASPKPDIDEESKALAEKLLKVLYKKYIKK